MIPSHQAPLRLSTSVDPRQLELTLPQLMPCFPVQQLYSYVHRTADNQPLEYDVPVTPWVHFLTRCYAIQEMADPQVPPMLLECILCFLRHGANPNAHFYDAIGAFPNDQQLCMRSSAYHILDAFVAEETAPTYRELAALFLAKGANRTQSPWRRPRWRTRVFPSRFYVVGEVS